VQETVEIGLGDLVDADIAKESARLQSLQVRQQLAVQALGVANGAPQTLLGLLR
jgi:flagellin